MFLDVAPEISPVDFSSFRSDFLRSFHRSSFRDYSIRFLGFSSEFQVSPQFPQLLVEFPLEFPLAFLLKVFSEVLPRCLPEFLLGFPPDVFPPFLLELARDTGILLLKTLEILEQILDISGRGIESRYLVV